VKIKNKGIKMKLIKEIESLLEQEKISIEDINKIKYTENELEYFKESDLKFDLIEKIEGLTFDDDQERARDYLFHLIKEKFEESNFDEYLKLKEKVVNIDLDKFGIFDQNILTEAFGFVWNLDEVLDFLEIYFLREKK
jgi:cellobiose-specific phosphotransferase system component IIB